MKNRSIIVIVIIIVVAFIGRIIYVNSGEEVIEAEYPLDKIIVKRDIISIYIAENASLDEVINLDQFKGLRPNMSFEEITRNIGSPNDKTIRYDSNFSIVYTENGRIEYGNSFGSLSDGSYFDTNLLMFFKEDFNKDFLFKNHFLKSLPLDLKDKQIGVFIEDRCNFIINLSTKNEDWIQWEYPN